MNDGRTRTTKLRVAAMAALLWTSASVVGAASPAPGSAAAPSKEQREKMAQAHEKMAACLRSDRPVADCHQEMMQTCHDTMGGQGCGMMMMGPGPRGRGMGRGPGAAGTTQP